MDSTTEHLSDYACRLTYEDLSPEAVQQVKRTLVDTLGCGVGAFDSEPAYIARRMASRVQGNPPARILCTSQETSTDLAAFANTVLVRYLDCNDAYAARGTGGSVARPCSVARSQSTGPQDKICGTAEHGPAF